MKISILGLPGSGKTTLARKLAGLGLYYISSGDLARAHGFAGSKAELSGQLDPDEKKIIRLVKEAIRGRQSYVLDGFPRQSGQAQSVPIDLILYLDVPQSVATRRLFTRGRVDDTPTTVRNRMAAYLEFTHPLVYHCAEKGLIARVDADVNADSVFVSAMMELIKYETR